jgi:hypothetical protein
MLKGWAIQEEMKLLDVSERDIFSINCWIRTHYKNLNKPKIKRANLFNKNGLTLFSIMNKYNGHIPYLLLITLGLYKSEHKQKVRKVNVYKSCTFMDFLCINNS